MEFKGVSRVAIFVPPAKTKCNSNTIIFHGSGHENMRNKIMHVSESYRDSRFWYFLCGLSHEIDECLLDSGTSGFYCNKVYARVQYGIKEMGLA